MSKRCLTGPRGAPPRFWARGWVHAMLNSTCTCACQGYSCRGGQGKVPWAAMTLSARLLLTSNGLTSPALQRKFKEWLPSDTKTATVWYIPTAPLRDGWSERQARQQMASLKSDFGLGRVEWIDVEYVKGDSLREAVRQLGKVDVVYAEARTRVRTLMHTLAYHARARKRRTHRTRMAP